MECGVGTFKSQIYGKTLQECCVYASKVAAYKCMHTGARTYELSKEIADNL